MCLKSKLILTTAVSISLYLIFSLKSPIQAAYIENTKSQCADLLLVFARGSSQNSNHEFLEFPFGDDFWELEKESGRFFETFKEHLDRDYPHVSYKAHSIHNFPGYTDDGYKAVSSFDWMEAHRNALNADVSWVPGDYRTSVEAGKHETVGFIKDEIARCPEQKIAMGGYSQGAHVIGETLFHFTEAELDTIEGVALFGDPKFVAASGNPWNPFDSLEAYPWKRGTASDRERGSADARIPYVPESMEYKVFSWCFTDDFVCAGTSGLRKNIANGHTRYQYFGIQQAAVEIIQTMAPKLYAVEKTKGGIDKAAGPTQPIPFSPNTKPIDFMFLVNTSFNMNDVFGQLRLATPQVMPVIKKFFNARYAIADFTEFDTSAGLKPHISPVRQNFQIFETGTNNLEWNFVRKLAGGLASSGGGDVADPHILAIERASMLPTWRTDAVKHLVVITDRPMKETYTYNICDSTIYPGFYILTPPSCLSAPVTTEYSTTYHPEMCDSINQVLTQFSCTVGLKSPSAIHNITRNLEGALRIAQAKNIAVTFVVPHPMSSAVTDKPTAKKKLEHFAKATGGLYIEYPLFNQASYSDMMWQVLNHEPKQLALAYHDTLDVLGATQASETTTYIKAKTNVPVVFDVSGGRETFPKYKWDFDADNIWDEESASPVIEHTFSSPKQNGFMKVGGFLEESTEPVVELALPLAVESYEGARAPPPPFQSLGVPDNVLARRDNSGLVTISWEDSSEATSFVVGDPETGLPLASAPTSSRQIQLDTLADSVEVWLLAENGSSKRVTLPIEETSKESPLVADQEIQNLSEEKVYTETESSPWSQYREQTESVVLASAETQPVDSSTQRNITSTLAATDSVSSPSELDQLLKEDNQTLTSGNQTFNSYFKYFIIGGALLLLIVGLLFLRHIKNS